MDFRTGSFSGGIAMGLAWALAWASPGMAIEAVANISPAAVPFSSEIDMWPQTLGLPGLVAGALFSLLLLITDRRRTYADLSLSRSGAWGGVAGLLVGALVVWGMDTGLSQPVELAMALVGIATLLGALAGVGSILLSRYAARRRFSATPAEG